MPKAGNDNIMEKVGCEVRGKAEVWQCGKAAERLFKYYDDMITAWLETLV